MGAGFRRLRARGHERRRAEADEFYEARQTGIDDAEARLVQRQAFAGMLWSKQYYYFDVLRMARRRPAARRRRRAAVLPTAATPTGGT